MGSDYNFFAEIGKTLLICFVLVPLAIYVIYMLISHIKEQNEAKEEYLLKQKQEEEAQQRIEELKSLSRTDPEAYFQALISDFVPTVFPDLELDSINDPTIVLSSGLLGIEMDMPSKTEMSNVLEDQYVTRNGTVRANFATSILPREYEKHLYQLCLETVAEVFNSDINNDVKSVLFNGFVTDYSKTTGQLERRLIMSLLVNREQFSSIDLNHVDPKACFKSLKGVSSARLIDIVPVTPVLELNKTDHRFIDSKEVIVDKGTNLASMPWDDFEQLVRDIFEVEFAKHGGEVKVTQASRDGGVDAVVFDPDPLRGGKIILQAKRYTNTVPVSAVRDLYGTVINEGANTGILITTSDYGPDSYEFAKDKPLKLLNGGHLLGLMEKNGRQAYIDLKEAKEQNNGSNTLPPTDLFSHL